MKWWKIVSIICFEKLVQNQGWLIGTGQRLDSSLQKKVGKSTAYDSHKQLQYHLLCYQ